MFVPRVEEYRLPPDEGLSLPPLAAGDESKSSSNSGTTKPFQRNTSRRQTTGAEGAESSGGGGGFSQFSKWGSQQAARVAQEPDLEEDINEVADMKRREEFNSQRLRSVDEMLPPPSRFKDMIGYALQASDRKDKINICLKRTLLLFIFSVIHMSCTVLVVQQLLLNLYHIGLSDYFSGTNELQLQSFATLDNDVVTISSPQSTPLVVQGSQSSSVRLRITSSSSNPSATQSLSFGSSSDVTRGSIKSTYNGDMTVFGDNNIHLQTANGKVYINESTKITGDATITGTIRAKYIDVTNTTWVFDEIAAPANHIVNVTVGNLFLTNLYFKSHYLDVTTSTQIVGVNCTTSGGITVSNGATIYSGGLALSGGLTVTNRGFLLYDGGQTINSGGLVIKNHGQTITNGGLVVNAGGVTITSGGIRISDNGLALSGGVTVWSGGVTATGGVTVNSAGLQVLTGGVTIANNGIRVTGGGSFLDGGVVARGGLTVSTGGLVVSASGLSISGGGLRVTGGMTLDTGSDGMHVTGGVTIYSGDLYVVDNFAVGGDFAVGGNFAVDGDVNFYDGVYLLQGLGRLIVATAGALFVDGSGLLVGGGLTVSDGGLLVTSGGMTVSQGGLIVAGGATIDGSFLVVTGGASVASGGLGITGGATVNDNGLYVRAGGVTVLAGGLRVTASGVRATGGATIFDSGLSLSGGVSILSGGLGVTGGVTIKDTGLKVTTGGGTITAGGLGVTAGGVTITTGGLGVTAGGVTITAGGLGITAGGLKVTGGVSLQGGLKATGGITINDSGLVVTTGGVSLQGGLKATGGITINDSGLVVTTGGLTVTGASGFSSGLVVSGGLTVHGSAVYFNSASVQTANWDTSDRRLKTALEGIESPLEKISKIRGMYFSWVDADTLAAAGVPDASRYSGLGRQVGVFAQDVLSVLPEAVTSIGGKFLAVKYSYLVPLLFEGFHELVETLGISARSFSSSSDPTKNRLLQAVEELERELRETRADLAELRGALDVLTADVQRRLENACTDAVVSRGLNKSKNCDASGGQALRSMAEGLARALGTHLRGGALFDSAMVREVAMTIDSMTSWHGKLSLLMAYFEGDLGDRAAFERVLTDYGNSVLYEAFVSILRNRDIETNVPDMETFSFLFSSFTDCDGASSFADIMQSFVPEISAGCIEEVAAAFADSIKARAENSTIARDLLKSSLGPPQAPSQPTPSSEPLEEMLLGDELGGENLKLLKKYVVQRFDEHVVYAKSSGDAVGGSRRGDINLINAVDCVSGKIRFRDGKVVSTKGEKVLVAKNPLDEYDGGSRGKVKSKGKRGKGFY